MALTAYLYHEAERERRGFFRRMVARETIVRDADEAPRRVLLHDLSQTGAQIECGEPLAMGEMIRIGLPGAGAFKARVVNQRGTLYGCVFEAVMSAEAIDAAFNVDPVVQAVFAAQPLPPLGDLPEPAVEKWPPAARVAVPILVAAALWLGIAWLI